MNAAQSACHTTETVRVTDGLSYKHRRKEQPRLDLVVNNKRIAV